MKRMVRAILGFGLLAAALVIPPAASAQQRGHLASGAVIGVGVAPVLVPGVVVSSLIPIRVLGPIHYPSATCWDFLVAGYWYQGIWVPAHFERVCR